MARALLKDAPIVLLDEVTSALDPVNEAAVHEGVERLMAGRTVVMVAHRMRTVRRADRIVFLDGGRIVEEGSHDQRDPGAGDPAPDPRARPDGGSPAGRWSGGHLRRLKARMVVCLSVLPALSQASTLRVTAPLVAPRAG
ncbi:hypothetical protein AB0C33_50035 [Nonomuraea sp. NPDC048881]|uniref:hypothetical protein n=1 Tax=Nonomuraea sp. NPDC048881 TaxID=3155030 RepID=UPI0033EC87D6